MKIESWVHMHVQFTGGTSAIKLTVHLCAKMWKLK